MECDRLLLGSNGRNGQEPVIAKITSVGPFFITFATPVNFVILLIKNIEFAFFFYSLQKKNGVQPHSSCSPENCETWRRAVRIS